MEIISRCQTLSKKKNRLEKRRRVYTVENALFNSTNMSKFMVNYRKITSRNLKKAEFMTRHASGSQLWHSFRRHSVSGTLSKDFLRDMEEGELRDGVIKRIRKFHPMDLSFLPDVAFGISHEPIARKQFLKIWRTNFRHRRARVDEFGIQFRTPVNSFCVDGVVVNEDGTRYVLEIKTCPSLGEDKIKDRQGRLRYLDKSGNLRRSHKHYYQLMYYCWCLNLNKGIFFVWAKNDFSLEIIPRDKKLCKIFDNIESFYLDKYIKPRF